MDSNPYKRILIYAVILALLVLLFPKHTKADLEITPVGIPETTVLSVSMVTVQPKRAVERAKQPLTALQLTNMGLIVSSFPNDPIMVKIAEAESKYIHTAKNPKSTAKGLFQILDSTWKSEGCIGDVLVAENNIECARKLYKKYGTSPWNPSKGTWGVI